MTTEDTGDETREVDDDVEGHRVRMSSDPDFAARAPSNSVPAGDEVNNDDVEGHIRRT
ncbi:MAG: hypothetical protein ACHQ4F_01215 [Candidatus Dormibacteria bacterium]